MTVPFLKRASFILVLMVFGMLLEMASIAIIVPSLALQQGSGFGGANIPFFQKFFEKFSLNIVGESALLVGIVAIVFVYLIKATYLAWLAWFQGKFIFDFQEFISQKLFHNYLHQSYEFHLGKNSSELVRNVISETNMFIHSFVMPGLTIISESLILIGLISVLLFVEPLGALLTMVIFFGAGLVFYKSMRSKILRWGVARQYHDGLRMQYLQEGLSGFRDVKFYGREKEFLKRFEGHNHVSIDMDRKQVLIQQLPRLVLELLAVTALTLLVILMLNQEKSIVEIIPIAGLFAAAAFRVMPSVNRIISSGQSLRYALSVLNNLYEEISKLSSSGGSENTSTLNIVFDQLTLSEVSYKYPNASIESLSNINLTITRGSSIGIVGESGSGKSTLINVILGLVPSSGGKIIVNKSSIDKDFGLWRRSIGYVPQSIFLIDDSLRRNIAFGISDDEIDDISVRRAINLAQLESFLNQLPRGLDTIVGERGARLSGGQLQRIGIARALYHDPQVLILDEATSSLDIATEQEVMKAVKELHGKKTIILVAHRLSTVSDCDLIYRLEHGEIVESGRPGEMLR